MFTITLILVTGGGRDGRTKGGCPSEGSAGLWRAGVGVWGAAWAPDLHEGGSAGGEREESGVQEGGGGKPRFRPLKVSTLGGAETRSLLPAVCP